MWKKYGSLILEVVLTVLMRRKQESPAPETPQPTLPPPVPTFPPPSSMPSFPSRRERSE